MAPKDASGPANDQEIEDKFKNIGSNDNSKKKWEEFDQIIERLDRLIEKLGSSTPFGRFANSENDLESDSSVIRKSRAALPDPRLVRNIIRARQSRIRFFGNDLFADPVWDMLLDLAVARVEHRRVSVTSLCIASGVPTTTALRWITEELPI